MNEQPTNPLEQRSRRLFDDSVEAVDMRIRSRLTQARHAALEARGARARVGSFSLWSSAVGVSAAAVLGVAIWMGGPVHDHGLTANENAASYEDLDIVASTDEGAGDELELLQDDLEFYGWAADKTANPGPGSV